MSTLAEARDRTRDLANDLGADSISALRDVPAQQLKQATLWNPVTDPGITVFTPFVDGDIVPTVPAKRFAQGQQMNIPMIAGWNAVEEQPIFVPRALPHDTAEEFKAAAQVMFGDRTDEFLQLYPANTDAQAKASAEDLIGDLVISQQTWEAADSQRRVWNAPVYMYNFTYTSDYSPVATHASEVPFVFGTLEGDDPSAGAQDRAISESIRSYWTNFAKTGDPNGAGLSTWPVYEEMGVNVLELGSMIQAIENPRQARFEFIRSLRNEGVLPADWRNIDVDDL